MQAMSLEWTFEPSEAVDAAVFCNAISTDDMYARHYPGLRAEWAARLGPSGLEAVDRLHGSATSMSSLAGLLCCAEPHTLDDVVALLRPGGLPRLREALTSDAAAAQATYLWPQLRAVEAASGAVAAAFEALAAAGFAEHWRARVRPELEAAATELRARTAGQSLAAVGDALAAFLGTPRRPSGTSVLLVHYSQPISFMLPGHGMAVHPRHVPNAQRLGCMCVHESLHGFPGSAEALAEQRRLFTAGPALAWHHEVLTRQWHIGEEEHLVTGAEAFLTERLGLRTPEQCVAHLAGQNGGMPFAAAVYARLRDAGMAPGWPGFGQWVAEEMRTGRVTFASGAATLLGKA